MSDLTDEAKKEIAEAISIVKEDRILKYLRENKNAVPASPPIVNPSDPNSPDDPSLVDPDKPVPPPVKPPAPPKPKKRGLYWADTDDE